jgi:hypothetical protein
MPIAEFEEKQFEMAANIELALQQASVFAAGQVLEAVVGYDVAAHPPANAPIWKLIGIANAPTGIQLVPNLWQRAKAQPKAADLPSSYVSLILQYKRPRYLADNRAKQWATWNSAYYRFMVYTKQQPILEVINGSVNQRAVVRYASPVFWEYSVLQTKQNAHDVLAATNYPEIGKLTNHQAWTYQQPGNAGHPNPRRGESHQGSFQDIWFEARSRLRGRKPENLYQHLRGLAAGIGVAVLGEMPPWLAEYQNSAELDLTATQLQAVFDVVSLGEVLGRTGTSWFVGDLS